MLGRWTEGSLWPQQSKSNPEKAQETQLAEPKLFIKYTKCSPVLWNPKHIHCINTTDHMDMLLPLDEHQFPIGSEQAQFNSTVYTKETCHCYTSRLYLTLQSTVYYYRWCQDNQSWWLFNPFCTSVIDDESALKLLYEEYFCGFLVHIF